MPDPLDMVFTVPVHYKCLINICGISLWMAIFVPKDAAVMF